MLIFLSSILPGFQLVQGAVQDPNVKNCPTGQTTWPGTTRCVPVYCGENGDHDHNGNCIPCSSGKYYENGGSCNPLRTCGDITSQIEKNIDRNAISLGKQIKILNDDSFFLQRERIAPAFHPRVELIRLAVLN